MKKGIWLPVLICLLFWVFIVSCFADFQPQPSVTRNPHIKTIKIMLIRTIDPDVPSHYIIEYGIIVDDQFDRFMTRRRGDLQPYLTTQQKQQLRTFMDILWQKAEDEILP